MDIGFIMDSDDEGETWTQSEGKIYIWWKDGFGGMFPCDKPSIAPTRDGRLLMFMRTTLGVLFQSWKHFKTIEARGVDRDVGWVRPPIEPEFVWSFDEVGDLPHDWGMFSYANLNFAHGETFLEYVYRVEPFATDERDQHGAWKMDRRTKGVKRCILPIDWFYGLDR